MCLLAFIGGVSITACAKLASAGVVGERRGRRGRSLCRPDGPAAGYGLSWHPAVRRSGDFSGLVRL